MQISNFQFQISNNKFVIRNWILEIRNSCRRQAGFTLTELIVVMAVLAILLSLVTINLVRARHKASLSTTIDLVVADIKLQQVEAMTGDTLGQSASGAYGVYFQSDRYTVFKGTTYTSNNSTNIVTRLEPSLQFNPISLPSSTVTFTKVSGEITSYNPSLSSVTLRNTQTTEQKVIQFNKYGGMSVN